MAISQTEGLDFHIGGKGCNATVEFDPTTQVINFKSGLQLNAQNNLERAVCLLRISTPNSDQVLVPFSVKGKTTNRGGKMTVSITTNSGANIISTLKQSYTGSADIDVTDLFEPSENPQCVSSGIVGANINVFGTNAAIDLNDIRFQLQTQQCDSELKIEN